MRVLVAGADGAELGQDMVQHRRLQDRFVRQGKWDRTLASPDWHVFGQTLGLVGFGNIGQLVAKKLSGLDMQILVADPVVEGRFGSGDFSKGVEVH